MCVWIIIVFSAAIQAADIFGDNDFRKFSMMDFVSNCGYTVELHANIKTSDGYLLDMHRIGSGRNINSTEVDRPIVLLMHGLLGSAENWIITGPDKALAFLLVDQGYDVWLGNARGTKHSRKHSVMDPDRDKQFWQFSFHEIGIYDLTAKIDYILDTTKQRRLYYIGHSQGTTSFFVMCSEKPQYNDRITLMLALAPVAYCSNIPHSGARILSLFQRGIDLFFSFIGLHEFLPNLDFVLTTQQAICREKTLFRELCANVFFLVSGYDSHQLNRTILPRILKTVPAGASTKQFYHFAQLISSGYFQKFDHGLFGNLRKYNTIWTPEYDIKKITAPIAMFYSKNDWLSSMKDVEKLSDQLPNTIMKNLIAYKWFNHIDYLFANDGRRLLYDQLLLLMNQVI